MNQQVMIGALQKELWVNYETIIKLKKLVASRDRESANKGRRIKQLHADYWMAVHGSRRLEKRNRELHTECQTADAKFTQFRKDAAADRANLRDRNGELCMSINSLRAEVDRLSKALATRQEDLAACENKLACKCAEVDQREKYFYQPMLSLDAKDKEIERLRATIVRMDRNLELYAEKLTLKMAECQQLRKSDYHDTWKDEKIKTLTAKLSEAEKQLKATQDTVRKQYHFADQARYRDTDKIRNLEANVNTLKDRLNTMSNMDRSWRCCIAELRIENQNGSVELDKIRSMNADLLKEIERLQAQLDAVSKANASLFKESAGFRVKLESYRKELKQERAYSYETWLDFWRESKATAHMGEMIWRLIRERKDALKITNSRIEEITRMNGRLHEKLSEVELTAFRENRAKVQARNEKMQACIAVLASDAELSKAKEKIGQLETEVKVCRRNLWFPLPGGGK